MKYEKQTVIKDDGRHMVYFRFKNNERKNKNKNEIEANKAISVDRERK
jgi:hypothetical protein